ncbi:diguanylate cyclase (GGDEF)-like protein [Vreelandella songnenensis]|uniref:diguanylate cyclase n=1 Tax=Vreelandella songnenensis TaxID=1176243 RepID=A0A2T0V213_9GAMM|nr:diguanylate cyclase [Halomonas songnenensis]PRY64212.1 diguanylate cyclase (GGDEF)-like protein [Halomonas songnenensis]
MINDTLLKAIETELESERFRLRFAKALETRFEADTHRRRSHTMVVAGLIAIPIYCFFLINDYSFRNEIFTQILLLRLGSVFAFTLPIFWLIYRGVAPAVRETLMASIIVMTMLIACLILTASTAPFSYFDVFSFGLILIAGNIFFPLRFAYACLSSAVSILIMLIFVADYEPMPREAKNLAMLGIFTTTLFTLVTNYRLERSERKSYLLVLREKLRAGYYQKDNQKLSQLSMTDSLTNIANRRQFDAELATRWKETAEQRSCLGLMVIDIDHFKAYNDYYGHVQGDECLRQVAAAMQSESRGTDLLARFGGEEFVLLMANTTPAAAQQAADRIRHTIEALQIPNHGYSPDSIITVSVGVATICPGDNLQAGDLLRLADAALYKAKHDGRNRTWAVDEKTATV